MNYNRPYVDGVLPSNTYAEPDEAGGFDIRSIFGFVWRSKWKIALGSFFGLVLAALVISAETPTYTATASVLFQPQARNVVDIEDVMSVSAEQSDLLNQIEILRSTSLLNGVVEKLRLWDNPTFNPRLKTERSLAERIQPWLDWRTYVPWDALADLGVITPELPPEPLTPEEQLEVDKRQARNKLAESLTFRPVGGTQVIRISHTSDQRRQVANVANAVAREYIIAQLDTKLAATREATLWLSDRVNELEGEVSAAEAAVNDFESDATAEAGQTSELLRQQLIGLNDALADAVARTAQAEARYSRALEASADTDAIGVVAEFQTSPAITAARERERELLSDRAELLRLVSEDHERVRLVDVRVSAVREGMRNEADRIVGTLENEFRSAQAEQAVLRQQVSDIEQQLADKGEAEVLRRQLEREAEASRLIYENFLSRLKEITQQQSLEEADAVILSPAEPPELADSASKKRVAVIGLILGSGLGLGFAILMERLNNTYRSIEELQNATGMIVLGALPSVGRGYNRNQVLDYVEDKPTAALPEAVRSLRTSLLFSHVDRPPQIVMVTSTVPVEGKSTTSLLLAQSSAQMGKSAIIVDCDLRRPSLYTFFGSEGDEHRGLRGLLDGSLTLNEAIMEDERTGLRVLTSRAEVGTIINAADVLSSDRFGALLDELRQSYDLVVLDAPPSLSVTDARIISKRVDTTLYCVRWDTTPRDLVLEGLREFRIVSNNIAGLVVTMIDSEKAARYGYGYGSYGVYGRRYEDPYITN